MGSGACDPVAVELIPVYQNVGQVIVQTELEQPVTGACNCPAILRMVRYVQAVSLGTIPEASVVVCIATAAILYTVDVVVIVYHFMQKRGGNFFNGA